MEYKTCLFIWKGKGIFGHPRRHPDERERERALVGGIRGGRGRRRCRAEACVIFSTIIDYIFAAYKAIIFSLMVSGLNIREVRGGKVQGHWGGNSCAFGSEFFLTPTTLQPSQPNPFRP